LEGIDPILEGLQNSLARKLSFVESTNGKGRQSASSLMSWGSKLSRGLDRMGMGNAMVRTEEASGYIDVLIKVFQHVGVVGEYNKWVSVFFFVKRNLPELKMIFIYLFRKLYTSLFFIKITITSSSS
jgi:hypothetical protein